MPRTSCQAGHPIHRWNGKGTAEDAHHPACCPCKATTHVYHQARAQFNGEQTHLWQPFQLVWGVLLSICQEVFALGILLLLSVWAPLSLLLCLLLQQCFNVRRQVCVSNPCLKEPSLWGSSPLRTVTLE